jgi:hypothetical protein
MKRLQIAISDATDATMELAMSKLQMSAKQKSEFITQAIEHYSQHRFPTNILAEWISRNFDQTGKLLIRLADIRQRLEADGIAHRSTQALNSDLRSAGFTIARDLKGFPCLVGQWPVAKAPTPAAPTITLPPPQPAKIKLPAVCPNCNKSKGWADRRPLFNCNECGHEIRIP